MACSGSVDIVLRCSSSWSPDREMNTLESTMQSIRPLIRPRSASCSVVTCHTEVRRISISPNESGSARPTRTSWSRTRRSRKRRKQSGNACRRNWRIQRISFALCNSQTTIDSVTHQLLYTVHRPLNRCSTCCSSSSSTDAASAWRPPASSNAFDRTATGLSLRELDPKPWLTNFMAGLGLSVVD